MDFEGRYRKLNDRQKQAVDQIDGPVMVIAGPGTGKTELLSMRAANILKRTDTLPENILCLTFTESGATAMRERLSQIIGPSAYKVAIHTFHSFGTEIINQQGQFFYNGAHFRPADELSSYEVIRSIFDELDYTSPLAGKMNGEYTHLNDTLRAISELKKSGLTSDELLGVLDQNDITLNAAEPLLADIFANRISKTTAEQLDSILDVLDTCTDKPAIPTLTPLSRIMRESLADALNTVRETSKTTAITAWKNTWLKKNDAGVFVLKSRERAAKLRALSFIYYQYLARMQQAELYDFDDMILRVVHAMEVFPELRFNLQEKHQYIMVDEFQDTNMAQMRILLNLTNTATGDQPNIMVVGDDDQAIYSFQGAEVGNIISFRDLYPATQLVTLVDNYRSAPIILDQARNVITQGSDRLERHIPELNKTLTAHVSASSAQVRLIQHEAISDEYGWLVNDIKQRIEAGESADSIAVLARRHHEIVSLLPYFVDAGLNVNYERRDNVLEIEVIKHLELVGRILVALYERRHSEVDSYLPELLAHPAWAFDPLDIWRLSIDARQKRQSWMEVMATTPQFIPLHGWLAEAAQMVANVPLERMIDHMMGREQIASSSRAQSSNPSSTDLAPPTPLGVAREGDEAVAALSDQEKCTSPLFNYFFAPEKLEQQPDEYLTYLEALRTLRGKLNEYQPNETPYLPTFLEFIRLHRELGSTIESIRPRVEQITGAINLMTAHKSKGLEFNTVYVVGAIDSAWGERVRSRSSLISYPENLPLTPTGNTFDERLRLFFVAMTRAKKQLIISYSLADSGGKETLRASFLVGENWEAETPRETHTISSLTHSAELSWYQPLITVQTSSMRELLAPALERYRISATDICTFLDVTHDGPTGFLLGRLLRFPQVASPNAAYGIAIHSTLQRAHAHLLATGHHRAVEDILHDYEEFLQAQYLAEGEYKTYLQKGIDTLQIFLEAKYADFKLTQQAEVNFAGQHAVLGEAHLTGSIDLIEKIDKSIIVTDYKTGRAVRDWKGTTDYEKVKLHHYRQQLMFYKLLIEHSRDYSHFSVNQGVLQFVEPTKTGDIITLDLAFTDQEIADFTRLIQAVWKHIKTLDLPDVSGYEPTYKGILAFEQDIMA